MHGAAGSGAPTCTQSKPSSHQRCSRYIGGSNGCVGVVLYCSGADYQYVKIGHNRHGRLCKVGMCSHLTVNTKGEGKYVYVTTEPMPATAPMTMMQGDNFNDKVSRAAMLTVLCQTLCSAVPAAWIMHTGVLACAVLAASNRFRMVSSFLPPISTTCSQSIGQATLVLNTQLSTHALPASVSVLA